ncbi:MAG: hypothetical protein QM765_24085 [Myxococcales bacterium]
MDKATFDTRLAYRRNLPHFQSPGAWYHVVFSLVPGLRLPPECCAIVLEACRKWDSSRWNLAACAAMPTLGTHVLCKPAKAPDGGYFRLSHILHDVKGASAWQINKVLGRREPVWEHESFDRELRNERDFWTVAKYVADNPVKEHLAASPQEYPYLYMSSDLCFGLVGAWLRGTGALPG